MSYNPDRMNPYTAVHVNDHRSTPNPYHDHQNSLPTHPNVGIPNSNRIPESSSASSSRSSSSVYDEPSPSISKESTPTLLTNGSSSSSSSKYLTINDENRIGTYLSKTKSYVRPVPSYEVFASQPSLYTTGTKSKVDLNYPSPVQKISTTLPQPTTPRRSKSSTPSSTPPTPMMIVRPVERDHQVGRDHPMIVGPIERSFKHHRHPNETLVCPICGKGYSRQSNLVAHTRDTHSTQKNIFCDVEGCDRVYKRISECRRHKRDMHGIPLPSELAGKTRRRSHQNPSFDQEP